jgi:hypothetical protein
MDLSATTARLVRAAFLLLVLLATRAQAQAIDLADDEMRW